MTFGAGDRRMQSGQRKIGLIMIELNVFAPIGIAVTSLAARTELALMRVLLLMTGYAGRFELIAIEIAGMASIAFDARMGAVQRELGFVVVEVGVLPCNLIVAGLAFWAIAIPVHVLQAMA
jgi:hypothetical protein